MSLAAGYAALLVALTPSAFANVIGIDLGVDFMKVRRVEVSDGTCACVIACDGDRTVQ